MARGRMLSKSFSTSVKRAALHRLAPDLAEFCQQLYMLLVVHADDWGRLPGDAFTVKLAVDPSSPRPDVDFDRALDALDAVGLIQRYTDRGGRHIIAIGDFDEHQDLHRRTESKYEAPPGDASLSASERDVEARIATALADGTLRVADLTVVNIVRQVRVGSVYLDILAQTAEGPAVIVEVKRQRVTRAALDQVRGYAARVPGAVAVVVGHGLAAGLDLSAYPDVIVGTYENNPDVIVGVSAALVQKRSGTLWNVADTRARLELKRTEEKRTKERKNATASVARSRARNGDRPNVAVLAAMVRSDVLPLRLALDELPEAAKARAASLHLAYDGRSIHAAIASATGQTATRRHG